MTTRRDFLKQAGTAAAAVALGTGRASHPEARSLKDAPNFLFFFPDQLRHDWSGLSRSISVPTPHLGRVAEQGMTFRNVYCASPLCAPSRASLSSGREYDRCGVPNHRTGNDYPVEQETFYSRLRDAGYHVMGCGKFDLHKPSPTWGVDGQHLLHEWGFSAGIDNAGKWDAVRAGKEKPADPYMAFLEMEGLRQMHLQDMERRRGDVTATFPTPLPEHAYSDNWIGTKGLGLLRRAPSNRPWFLQVNFNGPHSPWDVSERMASDARRLRLPLPRPSTELTPEEHLAIRQNYSAMITNIDRILGLYLQELEQRGELENTYIVFSSDHGEMLGDHDLWSKKVPFEASVGVPLIVSGPQVLSGMSSEALVSVMDLAATFLDLAGADPLPEMDARSIRPLLEGDEVEHRARLRSGLFSWRLVRDRRYKLIKGYDPEQGPLTTDGTPDYENKPVLLFDLQLDPSEMNNVAGDRPDIVSALSAHLPV